MRSSAYFLYDDGGEEIENLLLLRTRGGGGFEGVGICTFGGDETFVADNRAEQGEQRVEAVDLGAVFESFGLYLSQGCVRAFGGRDWIPRGLAPLVLISKK